MSKSPNANVKGGLPGRVDRFMAARGQPSFPPLDFISPFMDYTSLGFQLSDHEPPSNPVPPQRPSLELARPGFGRSPKADDVTICPNCDRELCTGESDEARIVFVVKACGHVYCGECARNRAVNKRKSRGGGAGGGGGPGRTKPFSACVVGDCGQPTRGASTMIQLFL